MLTKDHGKQLAEIARHPDFKMEPTYLLKEGDHVIIPAKGVVEERLAEGRIYAVKLSNGEVVYEIWSSVRPYVPETEDRRSIIKNDNIRIVCTTRCISSFIDSIRANELDLNPSYQRDIVWNWAQKEALIRSIFHNINVGDFLINKRESCGGDGKPQKPYEVIDGKQRITAIAEYYYNMFPAYGLYYNELTVAERRFFKQFTVQVAEVQEADTARVMEMFVMMNTSGEPMDKKHLEGVKEMIRKCESRKEDA